MWHLITFSYENRHGERCYFSKLTDSAVDYTIAEIFARQTKAEFVDSMASKRNNRFNLCVVNVVALSERYAAEVESYLENL